jgi:hypothetical protein
MPNKITKAKVERDISKYNTQDGYIEFDFGELRLTYNPEPYAGLRLEQIDTDKHGKTYIRKINLSHTQVKKLKRELRFLYPRD